MKKKLFIIQNNHPKSRHPSDVLSLQDESGNVVGSIVNTKNICLAMGGIEIEIDLKIESESGVLVEKS